MAEAPGASIACPACENPVILDRRTMGDLIECPSCRVGFRVALERSGEGFKTSAVDGGAPSEPSLELKKKIEIRGVLGRGGQGTVWRVRPKGAARDYAMKFLESGGGGAAAKGAGPQDLSAELDHPNIVGVYVTGADGANRYALYEIVEGQALSKVIAQGPMKLGTILDLAFQMAAGLAHSHAHGIVHRDFKPDNVLVTGDGQAKIADFGIGRWIGAKNTLDPEADEGFIGTPGYAAPEQISGWGVIRASDVYAFGMTLYEMSTGRLPFRAPSLEVLLHHQVNSDAPSPVQHRPDLPAPFAELILDCLRKSPAKRPQTMEEVAARLEPIAFAAGAAVPLNVDAEPYEPRPPYSPVVQRVLRPRVLASAAAMALAVLPTIAITFKGGTIAPLALGAALVYTVALLYVVVRDTKTGPAEWVSSATGLDHSVCELVAIGCGLATLGSGALVFLSASDPAGVVGALILSAVGTFLPAASGLVRWMHDATQAETRLMESRGTGRIECRGPSTVTLRIDGGAATRLPASPFVKAGRRELVLEQDKLTARYALVAVTGQSTRLEAALTGAGLRLRADERGGGPGGQALFAPLAGSIAIGAVGAFLLLAGLKLTGVARPIPVEVIANNNALREAEIAEGVREEDAARAEMKKSGDAALPKLIAAMVKQGRAAEGRAMIAKELAEREWTAPLLAAASVALEGFRSDAAGGLCLMATERDPSMEKLCLPESRARKSSRRTTLVDVGYWLAEAGYPIKAVDVLREFFQKPDGTWEGNEEMARVLCLANQKAAGCALLPKKGNYEDGRISTTRSICGCE